MKYLKMFIAVLLSASVLVSCNETSQNASTNASQKQQDNPSKDLIDTTKLKSDLNDIISSVVSGNPDTTKLKNAASDIMTTDADILSDSGIDKMYGNSSDPAVKAAANTLKKMRNGMGLTPGKLDSMKKEAEKIKTTLE